MGSSEAGAAAEEEEEVLALAFEAVEDGADLCLGSRWSSRLSRISCFRCRSTEGKNTPLEADCVWNKNEFYIRS